MIQIANGLKISLVKQYFDDWLVSIKQNRTAVFLEKKKNPNHSKQLKGFSILETVTTSASGQVDTFWLRDFVKSSLKNILEGNF